MTSNYTLELGGGDKISRPLRRPRRLPVIVAKIFFISIVNIYILLLAGRRQRLLGLASIIIIAIQKFIEVGGLQSLLACTSTSSAGSALAFRTYSLN